MTNSSTGIRETRLHIWPRGADVSKVREIVESLNLGYVVKPFWLSSDSEGVERVLVLGDDFQGGCTVDYIRPLKPEQMKEAVEWALGLREESRGARLWEDTMRGIFGADLVWENVRLDEGWSDV